MLKHQLAPAKLDMLFSDLNTKFSKHIVRSWGETGTRLKNLVIQRQMFMIDLMYLLLNHKVATMLASSDIDVRHPRNDGNNCLHSCDCLLFVL